MPIIFHSLSSDKLNRKHKDSTPKGSASPNASAEQLVNDAVSPLRQALLNDEIVALQIKDADLRKVSSIPLHRCRVMWMFGPIYIGSSKKKCSQTIAPRRVGFFLHCALSILKWPPKATVSVRKFVHMLVIFSVFYSMFKSSFALFSNSMYAWLSYMVKSFLNPVWIFFGKKITAKLADPLSPTNVRNACVMIVNDCHVWHSFHALIYVSCTCHKCHVCRDWSSTPWMSTIVMPRARPRQ